MVAVIKAGKSLRNALHYNENKVKQGVAKLIHASGYAKDLHHLGFTDKFRRLEKLTQLNEATTVNSVHISLNFDPSEKLKENTLQQIAGRYMQKLGFSEQPYLVYQHNDAAHPHIHIVTTNIQKDGRRIQLHNIGKNQSEKARKEIEQEFKLVKAEKGQSNLYELSPVNAAKVIYGRSGKSGTKRAITNVLDVVLPNYKFCSLHELNAVLRHYNILADQGSKESRIYKNGGLVYRVLNEKGEKVGVPIPASHLYNKPTLKFLQKKFQENLPAKQKHKQRVKNAIDLAILKQPGLTIPALMAALHKEKIQLVLRQNANGIIYGLTYVDQQTKCVFNGSDLGKPYSANQIQQRCSASPLVAEKISAVVEHKQAEQRVENALTKPPSPTLLNLDLAGTGVSRAIQYLMQPEEQGTLAAELREDVKKKKRKRLRQ